MVSLKAHQRGMLLWLFGATQFIVAMIVVQAAYGCSNYGGCYNDGTSPISNLGSAGVPNGNPSNITSHGVTVPWPTSPLWYVFNYSIVLLGACLLAGALWLSDFFPKGKLGTLALALFGIAGMGGAGVGVVPEDTILAIHSISALIAFGGIAAAVLLMAVALHLDGNWSKSWVIFTTLAGVSSLIGVILLELPSTGAVGAWAIWGSGWGFGACERLVIAGPFAWVFAISGKGLLDRKVGPDPAHTLAAR